MDDTPETLDTYTGVLYVRHKANGVIARCNVEFVEAHRTTDDDGPKALWMFQLQTTTPFKVVRQATTS